MTTTSHSEIKLKEISDKLDRAYSKVKDKNTEESKELHNCVENMKKELCMKLSKKISSDGILKGYMKERDFLSQQIDERMHQIWTLGALFVPVSFLIFAQAVAYGTTIAFIDSLLVATASLVCYSVWFKIYLRARAFNRLSYPRIHVLEYVLDTGSDKEPYFHGHLYLDYLRDKYKIRTKPERIFRTARAILFVLWILHISVTWLPTLLANLTKLGLLPGSP